MHYGIIYNLSLVQTAELIIQIYEHKLNYFQSNG